MGPWLIEIGDRDELLEWLSTESPHPEKSVRMVLKGDSKSMRRFLPRAVDAAKQARHRIVVWVRKEELLTDSEKAAFFDGGPDIIGVVIAGGSVRSWIYKNMTRTTEAVEAFEEAESAT